MQDAWEELICTDPSEWVTVRDLLYVLRQHWDSVYSQIPAVRTNRQDTKVCNCLWPYHVL